jgi:hypothetical protein
MAFSVRMPILRYDALLSSTKMAEKIHHHLNTSIKPIAFIQLFKDDLNDDEVIHVDMDERLNIMLEFSNVVRSFYQIYSTAEALAYGELACQKMDDLNLKRPNQTNEALQMIVEQLKRYFGAFK